MKIEKIELYRLKIPLKQPYKIATAEMKAFDCTIVSLHYRGQEGLGEAMADIQGYFWETADQVWQFAKDQGPKILGLPVEKARESISRHAKEKPCAVTPFLTALEMLNPNSFLAPPSEMLSVPMLGILQATDREGMTREIEEFIAQGYQTIKIKVGFEAIRISKGYDWHKRLSEEERISGRMPTRGTPFPRPGSLSGTLILKESNSWNSPSGRMTGTPWWSFPGSPPSPSAWTSRSMEWIPWKKPKSSGAPAS
jgi:hypothetical protein